MGLRRHASTTSCDTVFNYPTFAEAYKVAALDVTNKLRALSQFRR